MAEGVGVEPTRYIKCTSTDLKSVHLTRERFPSELRINIFCKKGTHFKSGPLESIEETDLFIILRPPNR